ncbi:MAG: hypothetical protein EP330_21460 [Deltaproteobacteria bacterium]|nr:MAG: hypothetical protein EP330_21460 [Deltaproteobacteria bacterium]
MNASTLILPSNYVDRRPPIARGWYMVLPSTELRPGAVTHARVCGRELAVWRTRSGKVRAADDVCPHLGGRLATQGRVRDERLECAHHGRRFDAQGLPEDTALSCLSMVPTCEVNGLVLVWHDPDGGAPQWEIPEVDTREWTRPVFTYFDVDAHPLHVMQDLADIEHFETVHRYGDIRPTRTLEADGPKLSISVAFGWDTAIPGAPKLPAHFTSEAWGLGYQVTEVMLPLEQVESRHFVMPTPIDAHRTRVHLGVAVRTHAALHRLEKLGRAPLRWPLKRAIRRFMLAMFRRDVGRDAKLWVDRFHVDDAIPAPTREIAAYRVWASQFLP